MKGLGTRVAPARPVRLITALELRVQEAMRAGHPALALVLFDLDGFWSRTGSTAALSARGRSEIARLRTAVRRAFPRASIQEFTLDGLAVITPASASEAVVAATAVRTRLAEGPRRVRCTVSAGVAVTAPRRKPDAAALVWAAAGALGSAKHHGGNQVQVAAPEAMAMKSNYYPRSQLTRLARVAEGEGRTESSLLREALDYLLEVYER